MPESAVDFLDAEPALPSAEDFLGSPAPSFTARSTGYHPVAADSPEYKMEGGNQDRQGNPVYTLDEFRRGAAPYVTVAMDSTVLPYGTELYSPQFPGIPFRSNDTGSAFKGKGLSRVDIARDTGTGANADEVNRNVTFTPTPTPQSAVDFLDAPVAGEQARANVPPSQSREAQRPIVSKAIQDWTARPVGGGAPVLEYTPGEPSTIAAAKAVERPVAEFYNFAIQPRNLALAAIAPVAPELSAAGFAAEMAPSAVPIAEQFYKGATGQLPFPQNVEAGTGAALLAAPAVHALAAELALRPVTGADVMPSASEFLDTPEPVTGTPEFARVAPAPDVTTAAVAGPPVAAPSTAEAAPASVTLYQNGEKAAMLVHTDPAEIAAGAPPVKLIDANADEMGFNSAGEALDTAAKMGLTYEQPTLETATEARPGAPGVLGGEPRQETAQREGPAAPVQLAQGKTAAQVSRSPDDFGTEMTPVAAYVIDDIGGIMSKSTAIRYGRYKGAAELWDGAPRLSHPTHNKIYASSSTRIKTPEGKTITKWSATPRGEMPDVAAQGLYDAGLIKDPYADTMWQELASESKSARSFAAENRRQEAEIKAAEKQFKVQYAAGSFGTERVVTVRDSAGKIIGQRDPFYPGGIPVTEAKRVARVQQVANEIIRESQVPFGFGPGAAAVGEQLRSASQLRQLGEVVSKALEGEPKASASRRIDKAVTTAERAPVKPATSTIRAVWQAVRDAYANPPRQFDFKSAIKDWQGADQRSSFENRKWIQEKRKELSDPLVREGISNYIEALSDPSVLAGRAEASSAQFRPGYEEAQVLTDAQKTVAENVRQYYEGMVEDGRNAGILKGAVEDYITHLVKRPNKITKALEADLQAGKLQKSFKYARGRVFATSFDLEQAGFTPLTKDFTAQVAAYDLAFRRSLAARALIKGLREARAKDGEPVTKFSGYVQSIQARMPDGSPNPELPPEAYLIKSRAVPENAVTADGRAYRIVDHPALRDFKFVVQEGDAPPAYYQADMLVHPDHWEHLNNVLKTSAFRQGKLGMVMQPLLKAGALAKQTRLSLSLFHLDQEGLHALFHRTNPANLEHINFDDPTQWALVRNGLQVADYSAMELFSEGLRGGGLVSKIPILGELQNRFNEFLFKDYIPRLKMSMARHALERNIGRYPNLAPEAVAELTANQANAAFGELNYKLMGRSPTVQDALRLATLAPDFLEGRAKFVGQALKPYGREQRTALILGAATMYVTGRVLNQWLDNDPHWNKLFSVIYNGREYRLRTVMGDAYEAVTDPRRFAMNRMSPVTKTLWTLGTGRDYRGIKLTAFEQMKDFLSWFVPIPIGGGNDPMTIPQRILGSAGVSNKPGETAIEVQYKAADKFRDIVAQTDPKIAQEIRRAKQETYAQSDYAKINRAILNNDKEAATAEIVALMKEKGKTQADLVKFYANLPTKPFTGSQALEGRWLGSMTPVERAEYEKARSQRIRMTQTFFSLLPSALQQTR